MIYNITIVGGGSSGWMTAAAIAYKFPEINLTLIESEKIPTIGVGESTLGFINFYMQMLDLKDDDWMPYCNATYKNSIQFTDFYKKGSIFQYPFGNLSTPKINLKNLDGQWMSEEPNVMYVNDFFTLKSVNPNVTPQDFVRYFNINGVLAEFNRQTLDSLDGYNFAKDTAYHFDAEMFGQFLKNKFCKNIKHVIGTVDEVNVDDGGIKSIRVNDKFYKSDLFIDCTGFKSLLIDKVDDEFIPFKNLMNDKAVVARIFYDNEEEQKKNVKNVTDCKVMNSGWIWDIPLWNRKSRGYVYSSKFIDDKTAEEEFRKETGYEGDVFFVNFKHGIRKRAWVKNVLSIGLSYGFIEPLESTGLFSTHENIIRFLQILKTSNKEVNLIEKQIFNNHLKLFMLDLSEFVSVHYGFSRNRHTEYWRHVTENVDYDIDYDKYYLNTLQFMSMAFRTNSYDSPITDGGMIYILAGMDQNFINSERLTFSNDKVLEESFNQKIYKNFRKIINERIEMVNKFHTSYDFLRKYVYYKE